MSFYASHRPRSALPDAHNEPRDGRILPRSHSNAPRSSPSRRPPTHRRNGSSPTQPRVKAFSAKSLASGSLYPAAASAATACGVGSSFLWTNQCQGEGADNNNDYDHTETHEHQQEEPEEDFLIEHLIVKLSNVPLTKSITCKTCQTEENTVFSDEENTPVVALQQNVDRDGRASHSNGVQESYSPYGRPEQVESYSHPAQNDHRAQERQPQSSPKMRQSHKRHSLGKQNHHNRSWRRSSGKTPRYIYPNHQNHTSKVQDDEISSLAATAANEILDGFDAMNLGKCSKPSFLMPYAAKNEGKGRKDIRNSIVASCLSPTIVDVPDSNTSKNTTPPAKSLLRASFPTAGASLCIPDIQDASCGDDTTAAAVGGGNSSCSLLCGSNNLNNSFSSISKLNVQNKVEREIQYWLLRLEQTEQYSKLISNNANSYSRKTADLHFNLGQAYMKCSKYDLAIEQFATAQTQWQHIHNSQHHITVARALDAMGLAMLRQSQQKQPRNTSKQQPSQSTKTVDVSILSKAQQVLQQAFSIRFHQLGVWHVDTVETYNKLASVHLHMGELREACHAYHQVFLVRRAIFGSHHPSVAISAHSLANVYFKLKKTQESSQWYDLALKIYEEDLQLSHQHPTVAKLLKDRSRLGEEC